MSAHINTLLFTVSQHETLVTTSIRDETWEIEIKQRARRATTNTSLEGNMKSEKLAGEMVCFRTANF